MEKKFKRMMILLLLIILTTTGCITKTKVDFELQDQNVIMKTTPKTVVKDLGNNLKVNAEVILPSNKFSVFSAINKKIGVNDISFIHEKKVNKENRINSIYDGSDALLYTFSDNSLLEIGDGYIEYTTENYLKYKDILLNNNELDLEKIDSVFNCINSDSLSKYSIFHNIFRSISDFQGEPSETRIYHLDANSLNEEQKKIEILKGEPITWTTDDEALLCIFTANKDRVPIFYKSYNILYTDRIIQGNYSFAIIKDNRLLAFITHGTYDYSLKIENPHLITINDAVEIIKYKFRNVHFFQEAVIENISLQYVIKEINSKDKIYELTPAWIFRLRESGPNEETYKSYYLFDAINGEEIELGGVCK